MKIIEDYANQYRGYVDANDEVNARLIWLMTKHALNLYISVATVRVPVYVQYVGERIRIDSESLDDAMIPATYRFRDRAQLRLLYIRLRIPAEITLPNRSGRIHGEELLWHVCTSVP